MSSSSDVQEHFWQLHLCLPGWISFGDTRGLRGMSRYNITNVSSPAPTLGQKTTTESFVSQ